MNKYCSGTTIVLEGEFRDINDSLIDPEIVKLKFYNADQHLMEEIIVPPSSRISVGKYIYNYVSSTESGFVIYEWYGEIGGKPSIDRKTCQLCFVPTN